MTMKGIEHEAHIPTVEPAPQAHARLPEADGHQRGTRRPEEPPPEGPQTPDAVLMTGTGGSPVAETPPVAPHAEVTDVAESAMAAGRARKPFTRETRLRNSAQLQLVRGQGEKMVGRLMMVRVLSPAPDQQLKTAIIISRHFSTKAVLRNRARRLFREALRELFPALGCCWVTVTPRQYIKGRKEQEVAVELRKLLRAWLTVPQAE